MGHVVIGFYCSQSIKVPDGTVEEMEQAALEKVEYPNASNSFEMAGDPEVDVVYNSEGETLYDRFEEEKNANRNASDSLADESR